MTKFNMNKDNKDSKIRMNAHEELENTIKYCLKLSIQLYMTKDDTVKTNKNTMVELYNILDNMYKSYADVIYPLDNDLKNGKTAISLLCRLRNFSKHKKAFKTLTHVLADIYIIVKGQPSTAKIDIPFSIPINTVAEAKQNKAELKSLVPKYMVKTYGIGYRYHLVGQGVLSNERLIIIKYVSKNDKKNQCIVDEINKYIKNEIDKAKGAS